MNDIQLKDLETLATQITAAALIRVHEAYPDAPAPTHETERELINYLTTVIYQIVK